MTPLRLEEHPYFSDGALWAAEGWYFDESNHLVACRGWSRVRRTAGAWTITGELRLDLFDPEPVRFQNVITVDPPGDGAREAFWTSENASLGVFAGRFTAIADALMSFGFSEDGLYQVGETLVLADEGFYIVRGTLARASETIGAWAVTLTPQTENGGEGGGA